MKNYIFAILIALLLAAAGSLPAQSPSPPDTSGGGTGSADSARVDTSNETLPDTSAAAREDTVQTAPAQPQQADTSASAAARPDTTAEPPSARAGSDTLRRTAPDTAAASRQAPVEAQPAALPALPEPARELPASPQTPAETAAPGGDNAPIEVQDTSQASPGAPPPAEDFLPEETGEGGSAGWIVWVAGLLLAVGLLIAVLRKRFRRESAGFEIPAPEPRRRAEAPAPTPAAAPATEIALPGGKLLFSHAQHPGSNREQQDAFGFSDPETARERQEFLAVIADGMGGHAHAREASRTAVEAFKKAWQAKSAEEKIPAALHRALRAANDAVLALAKDLKAENNLGATLTAALFFEKSLYWIAAGDSRLYLLRNGQLKQLTTDHLYLNKLREEVAKGRMKKEDAESHPDRDALYSFLGLRTLREIDAAKTPFSLNPGDRLLLCSEGVHRSLSASEIAQILSAGENANLAGPLVEAVLAKRRFQQENVTALCVALG